MPDSASVYDAAMRAALDEAQGAMDMGVLLDDLDLYPDEMLSDVARPLGFGSQFDEAVGLTSA